ncbi:MAG: peptidoglycan DD-metalloendopeptidase family protein [Anaerolineae bacterium]|nr:peptidoglycan DD-metalloendopeptidase family protein [Anaerolineae bacterium]
MKLSALIICLLCLASLLFGLEQTVAQPQADCGTVDAIDYPIDIGETLSEGYDDFGLFRARFGGMHTGLDIGFNRRGEPVHAVARGRVTYSDVNGWDTEKGVVIVEHQFPDGSTVYSLYGHMEQTDSLFFPTVGNCVARGDIVGTIGWPSRGLPHLHYELRSFLPNDGGPGYVEDNPMFSGWYHPLDFTLLWRARLDPATNGYATFVDLPTLPPLLLDTGQIAYASGTSLVSYQPPGTRLWQIELQSAVTGIAGLPGGRIAARTRDGQAIIVQNGRFEAVWQIESGEAPFAAVGETLLFPTRQGGVEAFSASGESLWSLPPPADDARLIDFQVANNQIALVARSSEGSTWRVIDVDGSLLNDQHFADAPVFAASKGGWMLLDGLNVLHTQSSSASVFASTGVQMGRTAQLTSDVMGNAYIFAGDREATLIAIDADGKPRWRTRYPTGLFAQAPLLDTGGGCLLYALDADGTLNIINTVDGSLLHQIVLYAGGVSNRHPSARLLQVDTSDRILVGAGFLSLLALDGSIISQVTGQNCLPG